MNVMPRNDAARDAHSQRERFWALVAPIVEAWGLVILVPLLMGMVTFAYLQSKTIYKSESVLRLSPEEVVILKSDRVFGVIVDRAIVAGIAKNASAASFNVVQLSNTDVLYKVSLYLSSSNGADVLLRDAIDLLINVTSPNKARVESLGGQLAVLRQKKAQLSESLKRVNRAYDNTPSPGMGSSSLGAAQLGYVGEPFTVLVGEIAKTETEIASVEMQLKGTFTGVDVILAPTQASRFVNIVGPFVTLAVVLGFALVSIFALVRDAWQSAANGPGLTRIRRAISRTA